MIEIPKTHNTLWHTTTVGEAAAQLGSSLADGLTGQEAKDRLARTGFNSLTDEKKEPFWEEFLEELREWERVAAAVAADDGGYALGQEVGSQRMGADVAVGVRMNVDESRRDVKSGRADDLGSARCLHMADAGNPIAGDGHIGRRRVSPVSSDHNPATDHRVVSAPAQARAAGRFPPRRRPLPVDTGRHGRAGSQEEGERDSRCHSM